MELLVVIVVLSLLIALLLPAIGSAIRTTKNAQVTTEINNLSLALEAFKAEFGDYPPSRAILCENGDYSPSNLAGVTVATPNAVDQPAAAVGLRTLGYLRKFWPRAQFSVSGPIWGPGTAAYQSGNKSFYDFNNDGIMQTTPVVLAGDECLVWFLGGLPTLVQPPPGTPGKPGWGLNGFAAVGANPFVSVLAADGRDGPFYEFKPEQLNDVDGDGFPSYYDALGTQRPYAYFNAYNGTGYDPNDVNWDTGSTLAESDDNGVSPITLKFEVPFVTSQRSGAINYAVSPPPNPYLETTTTPNGAATAQPSRIRPLYFRPQTFQIISAGGDALYGVGGQYTPKATDPLPFDASGAYNSTDGGLRLREGDNLTNVATGRLN